MKNRAKTARHETC